MNPNPLPPGSTEELLLRYLDGTLPPPDQARAAELLRRDPEARAFVREVAEQAVMAADIGRVADARRNPPPSPSPSAVREPAIPINLNPAANRRRWLWPAAAALVLLIAASSHFLRPFRPETARVSKVTGSCQYFSSSGGMENTLSTGISLRPGDTLDTRSCDAWIELKLRNGSTLTIAGHSTLRILDAGGEGQRFKLLRGSLWGGPPPRPNAASTPLAIQTPTMAIEMFEGQFNIQTSAAETMLRVNDGSARVRHLLDDSALDIAKGYQVATSLNKTGPLAATPQPRPINYWACDLWESPEVILGKWLPPLGGEKARLGADPLLWPLPGRDPLMLYAVALAAWKSTERPVLLEPGAHLLFRGRTEIAQTVRFGFSAQKMRGAFAGKFETDLPPAALGPAGRTWEVALPLSKFRPLHPQLAAAPAGLELTDVYALTINTNAGLEINHIELVPPQSKP